MDGKVCVCVVGGGGAVFWDFHSNTHTSSFIVCSLGPILSKKQTVEYKTFWRRLLFVSFPHSGLNSEIPLSPTRGDQAVRLAFSITSFLISLRGNREESDWEALNYPSLCRAPSPLYIPLLFLHFCLPLSIFFFCFSYYTVPFRLLGLWGVTLREPGCNNTTVICLDPI